MMSYTVMENNNVPKHRLVTHNTPLPSGWGYSVMRKLAMALTAIVLIVFLFGHGVGNLNLLRGETVFNDYLLWLNKHFLLHYGVWLVIVISLSIHAAISLVHWHHNRQTHGSRYHHKRYLKTNIAARSMMLSGSILLLFILIHIAHMQGWITFNNAKSSYQNLRSGLQFLPLFVLYLVGQLALGFHLYHGVWSLFQTLGINHPRYNQWRRPFAISISITLVLLNVVLILFNTPTVITTWRAFYG